MRLSEYTHRLYIFFARSFERLAKFAGFGGSSESSRKLLSESSGAPADWLDKVRDVPEGEWIDFTNEAFNGTKSAGEEIDQVVSGPESFDPGSERIAPERPRVHAIPDRTKRELEKRASGPTFAPLKTSRKRPSGQAADPPGEPRRRERTEPNENSEISAKRRYRLLPADVRSRDGSPKNPEVELAVRVPGKEEPVTEWLSPEPKREKAASNFPKTAPRLRKVAPRKKEGSIGTAIFSERRSLEASSAPITAGRWYERESPGHETGAGIKFPVKAKVDEETGIFAKRSENTETGRETLINSPRANEPSREFGYAAAPWIDLPEHVFSSEREEVGLGLGDLEHLLDLEREQLGKT